ncbi:hypothetical protein FRX31_034847 [Thalictrum thalictroides]|uniref:Uncharacterized protein n=1 Tax=Thalictrum thalictroides TaxID=46969 RepID=A0A7J6UTT9_THATH|nr:hypothetical protein FRX31_034847 [Thalictrum thalictroides]
MDLNNTDGSKYPSEVTLYVSHMAESSSISIPPAKELRRSSTQMNWATLKYRLHYVKELLVNLPLGIGFLSSLVFLIFPTSRKGIGLLGIQNLPILLFETRITCAPI